MLRGKLPFDSKEKHVLIEKTIAAEVDLTSEYWGKFTPYASDFLEKLLTKNVDSRLNVDQALQHPWIRNGNILIPRKINKRTMEEDLMRKTITSARLQGSIYTEDPKSATLDPAETADGRFIYTTPDIYDDMSVERKFAERSIAISRKQES
jgi:serine/threonine protein kinase